MDSRLVYIPDKEEVWLPRTLLSQEGTSVTVTTLNKDEPSTTIDLTPYEKLMKRVNRKTESGNGEEKVDIWTLPMVNEGKVGLVGDMTLLGFLGEPQILYNLRKRFESQIPYTATGDVIVAVNPYFRIANLYGKDLGATYLNQAFILAKGGQVETKLPPHVYTTSARAFADLISKHNNQSVLVSGESGAGKTETTKIMINFLVGSSPQIGSSNQATKILGANPLLESFGNAKTVRNDNSSRFGKYTTIQFANNEKHEVMGSYCTVYLLEKSRVVVQSKEERNYHFFYQILTQSKDTLNHLGLINDPNYYRYLQNGQHVVDGMNDEEHFNETVQALQLIGTNENDITSLIEVISSILHLGNINISKGTNDENDGHNDENEDASCILDLEGNVPKEKSPLYYVSSLLAVTGESIVTSLCTRLVVTPTESYNVPTKKQEALYRLEALSKDLYSRTFNWLVDCLNLHLQSSSPNECETISILDIFGFECFKHNTFEQLCINYANEKLQQRFTQDVLASVQLEYEREGINWIKIEFEDNDPCLKMIEGRLGLLAIIEEETARNSNDQKLSNKLEKILQENIYYNKPKLVRCGFEIKHYAGMVRYDANTFIAKNADALAPDLVAMMKKSNKTFVRNLYEKKKIAVTATTADGSKKKKSRRRSSVLIDTVTSQFKRNLNQLMSQISSTDVNYIRCIKPNAMKSSTLFDNALVCDQLRYSGVVEAIEISRAAFPNRMTRKNVMKRFSMLNINAIKEDTDENIKQFMNILFDNVGESPTTYVVGKTNVYFASGKLEELELKRSHYMEIKCVLLQKIIRGYIKRRYYKKIIASIILQKYARRRIIVRKYKNKKRGVNVIQTLWRRRVTFQKYRKIKKSIKMIQSFSRTIHAKKVVQIMRRNNAATIIQTFHRGKSAKIFFSNLLKSLIIVQSLARAKKATSHVRQLLHERREEAKLENQVAELKKQLAEQAEKIGVNHLNAKAIREENLVAIQLVEKLKEENVHLKNENEKLKNANSDLENKVRELQSKLDNERSITTATQSLRTRTAKKQRRASRGSSFDEEMFDQMYTANGESGHGNTHQGGVFNEHEKKQQPIRRSSKDKIKGLIGRGLSKIKTPLRSGNGAIPPAPISARRDMLTPIQHQGTPSTSVTDSGGSNSNPRRRSWLRRMFSGSENIENSAGNLQSTPSPSNRSTPTSIALQRRSGRGWVCLKHEEWSIQRVQPFYVHLRLITGGYVGMNAKRVAERMIPTDGWSSNFVFVATPLSMPSKNDPTKEEKLVALRYSLSQTHLAPQSFFMGWSKKLGAHTDQGDRCTPNEWFTLEAVQNEESVFAIRHYETGQLLSVGKDSSVGFADMDRAANVDEAVKARTLGIDEVALVQIEVLENKDEYDVVFTSFQLGLRVSRTTPIVVRSFTRNAESNNSIGEAERIGSVCVGDSIVAVQGVDVSKDDRRTVLRAISESDRPLTIRFKTSRPENDAALMGPNRETFERALQ